MSVKLELHDDKIVWGSETSSGESKWVAGLDSSLHQALIFPMPDGTYRRVLISVDDNFT